MKSELSGYIGYIRLGALDSEAVNSLQSSDFGFDTDAYGLNNEALDEMYLQTPNPITPVLQVFEIEYGVLSYTQHSCRVQSSYLGILQKYRHWGTEDFHLIPGTSASAVG